MQTVRSFIVRLFNLFRKRRQDREFAEEMESHLAMHIEDAINALPPYHKAVIVMREIEGMSYAEMATTLKVSKGTIMSRLHHARQKLQQSLSAYLEGDMVVK